MSTPMSTFVLFCPLLILTPVSTPVITPVITPVFTPVSTTMSTSMSTQPRTVDLHYAVRSKAGHRVFFKPAKLNGIVLAHRHEVLYTATRVCLRNKLNLVSDTNVEFVIS